MPNRSAIYARISETGAKRDKVSDQLAECREFAENQGYTVTLEFSDDGITAMRGKDGKVKDRAGFDALLDAITAGEVDVVIATEEARFDRDGVGVRLLGGRDGVAHGPRRLR